MEKQETTSGTYEQTRKYIEQPEQEKHSEEQADVVYTQVKQPAAPEIHVSYFDPRLNK
jgi:hypothetical protein